MFRGFRRSLRIFFFFSRSVCFFPPFFSDCRSHQSTGGKETHPQPLLCPVPSSASRHPLCLTLQENTRSSRRCWQHWTRQSPQTPSQSLWRGSQPTLVTTVTQPWWPVFFCP